MVDTIKKLCKERGTSIKALEKELGFGNGTIRRWDTNAPSSGRVDAVAAYFGITADELKGIKKEPTISAEDDELNEILEACRERSDLRMLFKLANGATVDDVKQAIKIIEALRKND